VAEMLLIDDNMNDESQQSEEDVIDQLQPEHYFQVQPDLEFVVTHTCLG
jgi:hypothetical protein